MSSFVSWLIANPIYGFAGLVGLSIGIFYGFDGWRGDTKDIALKDSPRIKNMIWVLGPGVTAFIGDVKVLDPNVDKALLLLAYFLPCFLSGALVVGIWGIVIGVSRACMSLKGKSGGYSLTDAVGDYFFYGYRYYREKAEKNLTNAQNSKAKIALFLDVDLTITEETIQSVYARELNVKDDLDKLENEFKSKKMTSDAFGKALISLFAKQNFTEEKAGQFFKKVDLRNGADKLFSLQDRGLVIYLVSSGPNYYVDKLARLKDVPYDRVKCSQYSFFPNGGVLDKCDAVDDDDKINFVIKERSKFNITVGVGDNEQRDKFVTLCTIALLTTADSSYCHVPNLDALHAILDKFLD
jgi:2-hydroxy-3-keto-5-methylthiopentenyl-1-phosphate phosphatase